jgi:hypothetical protein
MQLMTNDYSAQRDPALTRSKSEPQDYIMVSMLKRALTCHLAYNMCLNGIHDKQTPAWLYFHSLENKVIENA